MKEDWLQWFTNIFDKKSKGSGVTNNNSNNEQNKQLAEELRKPIIRNFKKRTV